MVWRPDTGGTGRRSVRSTSGYSLVGQSQATAITEGVNTEPIDPPLTVHPDDILGLSWNGVNPVPYDEPAAGSDACASSSMLQV